MFHITNRSKTIKVYNLPHAKVCTEEQCLCLSVTTELHTELEDGTRGLTTLDRKLGSELTLLGGETKEIPNSLGSRLKSIQVLKRDLDQGVLRLVELPERVKTQKTEDPPTKAKEEAPPPRSPRPGNKRSESVKE